jgi:hypothetical protein
MHLLLLTLSSKFDLKLFRPPGRSPAKFHILAGLGTLFLTSSALAANPTFVQGAFLAPSTPQSKVTVPFIKAQTAGDCNVVVVGWNDATAQVSSITDSKGNVYQLAVGPTVLTGATALSQSIYYAKNIAAAAVGANTVTLNFTVAAAYPDVRILEYRGLDPLNPLDVVVGATGNSATSTSGAVITKNAIDLLVGANVVWTTTSAHGSAFVDRMITSAGDIVEDEVVTTAGSYSASASLTSAGPWIQQMVAFRSAGSPTPTPTPTVSTTVAPVVVNLAYVQSNFMGMASGQTTVVPFQAAQTAGNLNVVLVGWNDATAQVTSVTDTNGNVYQLAVGPTVLTGSPALSQCVYYAKNISSAAASANAVTVQFNTSAYYSDTRILEYTGVDQVSPLDVSSAATGSTATASSGAVTTKNAKDLLVGGNVVWTATSGPGSAMTRYNRKLWMRR